MKRILIIVMLIVGVLNCTDLTDEQVLSLRTEWDRISVGDSVRYVNGDNDTLVIESEVRIDLIRWSLIDSVETADTSYTRVLITTAAIDTAIANWARPVPDSTWTKDINGDIVDETPDLPPTP